VNKEMQVAAFLRKRAGDFFCYACAAQGAGLGPTSDNRTMAGNAARALAATEEFRAAEFEKCSSCGQRRKVVKALSGREGAVGWVRHATAATIGVLTSGGTFSAADAKAIAADAERLHDAIVAAQARQAPNQARVGGRD
jgi:hypothetical protein